MKSKKADLARREFLRQTCWGAGLAYVNPVKIFLAGMIEEMVRRSEANALGITPDKKLINFVFLMGLPRWNMDMPLIPDTANAGRFQQNKTVGNALDGAGNLIYQTYSNTDPFNGIQMPMPWSKNIPTSVGGSVPMANLAQNMLMMMGVDFQIDSHPTCQRLQIQPVAGKPSFTGMVADLAQTPIPSITYSGIETLSPVYQSARGVPNIDLRGTGNPLQAALSAFTGANSITEVRVSTVKSAVSDVFNAMSRDSALLHPYLPNTYTQRLNAQNLIADGFSTLQSVYGSLKNKYSSLISRSLVGTDSNIFMPVELMVLPGSSQNQWQFGSGQYYTGSNFNSVFSQASITYLAESMAMAEYMFLNGYTSAANLLISAPGNLSGTPTKFPSLDFHFTGAIPQMIMTLKTTRAFYACLYELIKQMKAKTVGSGTFFDQTLIQVTGDFNRNGLDNMSGSDHGFNGSGVSWFSGMIEKCELVGNIKCDKAPYTGSWGLAAGITELNGQTLRMGNIASTVAVALDVPSPTPNDAPMFVKENGKLVKPNGFPRGTHT